MILDKIVKVKREEVRKAKKEFPLASFKNKLKKSDRDFKKAILDFGLIAEVKKKSPSKGIISKNFNFKKIVSVYEGNKYVKAISMLTDIKFFGGAKLLIHQAKKITKKPILRKDFIIDEYQVYESRMYGADAILLIARILSKQKIRKFISIAKKLGMDSLVEVHSLNEVNKLPNNVEIIGINNRDLDTMKIDLDNTDKIVIKILLDSKNFQSNKKFKNKIIVSESGINDSNDLNYVMDNINVALVGTSLVKAKNIDDKINSLFKPKIKICGITNLKDASLAASLGADFLGFILYKKSKRYVDINKVKKIIAKIKKNNNKVKFVGVFVNSSLNEVKKLGKCFDFIQLHGDESNEVIKKVGKDKVIKAFRVKSDKDINKINNSVAKYVLLDSYHKDLYGGTGKTFNWNIVSKIKK